ncbi:MAG: hypothetical protein NZL83_03510 [Candidatus Absconditabacterales bacterium]|nr:hypothetical protein [Candidatus Absconditabacterales bacterium]
MEEFSDSTTISDNQQESMPTGNVSPTHISSPDDPTRGGMEEFSDSTTISDNQQESMPTGNSSSSNIPSSDSIKENTGTASSLSQQTFPEQQTGLPFGRQSGSSQDVIQTRQSINSFNKTGKEKTQTSFTQIIKNSGSAYQGSEQTQTLGSMQDYILSGVQGDDHSVVFSGFVGEELLSGGVLLSGKGLFSLSGGTLDFLSYARLFFLAPHQTVATYGSEYILYPYLWEKEARQYGFLPPKSSYESIQIIKKIGLMVQYKIDDLSMQKLAHFVSRFPRFRTFFGSVGQAYQSNLEEQEYVGLLSFFDGQWSEFIVFVLAGIFCMLFFLGSSLINEYLDGLTCIGSFLHRWHVRVNRYRVYVLPVILPFLFLFLLWINDLLPETQSRISWILSCFFIGIIVFFVSFLKDVIYGVIAKRFGYTTTWQIFPLGFLSLFGSGGLFKLRGLLPCPTWGNVLIIDSEKHLVSMRLTLLVMLFLAGLLRVIAEGLTGWRHIFIFGLVYGIIADCCRSIMPVKPSWGVDLHRAYPLWWVLSFLLFFGLYIRFSFLPDGDAYAIIQGLDIIPRKIISIGCFFACIIGLLSLRRH